MVMKRIVALAVMALMAVGTNAQAVVAEIDWTKEYIYYDDVWYTDEVVDVSVTKEGLIIEPNLSEGANWWEAQVPILAHLKEFQEGERYQVKLTVNSTVAGVLHLNLQSGDSESNYQSVDLKEGLHDYTIDFPDYPTWGAENGVLMYDCGNLPGTHIISKVELIDLDGEQIDDIIYKYSETDKTAEVKGLSMNSKGVIVIPETVTHNGEEYVVTKIGEVAFFNCSNLISIDIANSITSIEKNAFWGCSNLKSVTIPNSVTRIGYESFYGCSSLSSIDIPNSVTRIDFGAFVDCSGLVSIDIPSSVTRIDARVFAGCTNLVSVNFLGCDANMDDLVFYGCPVSQINIVISDYSSFCNNGIASQLLKDENPCPITLLDNEGNEIKEFVIPDGVTFIKKGAFYNCTELESVTIPASMEKIFQQAFEGCQNLRHVNVQADIPPISYENSFPNYDITLRVPEASMDIYMSTDPWSKFGKIEAYTRTDISHIKAPTSEAAFFNLNGQRISQPTKGIYIQNGKKVVIK